MAYGNTFGGWALSSYGSFWISLGIIFTPGGFGIANAYGGENSAFYNALGLYLIVRSSCLVNFCSHSSVANYDSQGWFIYTVLVWLMTLRSTVAFNSLFLFVWLTFLMLGTGYIDNTTTAGVTSPNGSLIKAGGVFGIIAGFIAWWNMMAGIADKSNSFFLIPVLHFPWSEKGREKRRGSVVDPEKNE